MDGAGLVTLSLLDDWLLLDSERGTVIVFSCRLTEDTTSLQGLVPNPWSHKWPLKFSSPTVQPKKDYGDLGNGHVGWSR